MSEELSREDVNRAIDALVEELLGEAGVTEPPVDAVALARHLGLETPDRARRGRNRPPLLAPVEATPAPHHTPPPPFPPSRRPPNSNSVRPPSISPVTSRTTCSLASAWTRGRGPCSASRS